MVFWRSRCESCEPAGRVSCDPKLTCHAGSVNSSNANARVQLRPIMLRHLNSTPSERLFVSLSPMDLNRRQNRRVWSMLAYTTLILLGPNLLLRDRFDIHDITSSIHVWTIHLLLYGRGNLCAMYLMAHDSLPRYCIRIQSTVYKSRTPSHRPILIRSYHSSLRSVIRDRQS